MQAPAWLLFLNALLWLAVFMVHAIRINPSSLSRFELKRLASTGDAEATRREQRERLLPRLYVIRHIIETILIVAAIGLTIYISGWLGGIMIATALSLLLDPMSRSTSLSRFISSLYEPQEARLLEVVKDWSWLDWLRGVFEERDDKSATSRAELQYIIERSADVLTRDELLRFQASLVFDTHTVEDVMTPISVVDVANVTDSLGPLVLDDLHKTGHSRFPVIDNDVHHVVGILYLHDIINLKSAKPSVREAMDSRVHYIHEKQTLEHALNGFLKSHHHLFVVVNDYRETVGVVTLEDVLETLLGKKIVDEFDQYEDLRAVAESNPRKNNLPKGKTDI